MKVRKSNFLLKAVQAILTLFFLCSIANSQQRVQGFVEVGGFQYSASSSVKVQRSFPNATVTIYNAGTTTLASIFTNSSLSTPKSNPFVADSVGYWYFYAANGRYDVNFTATGLTTYTYGDIIIANTEITPATTINLGIVTLSVPASNSANPIVVGINDPKLNFLGNFTKSALLALASPRQGDFAQVTDNEKGFWYYTGTLWKAFNGIVDIKDFGAKGDGVTNDSAAFASATNFLRGVGGGTLQFSAGKFKMASSGSFDLTGCNLKIQGVAGRSQIFVATGISTNMWAFQNAESVSIEDTTFVGDVAVNNDCAIMLSFTSCQTVYFNRINVYGVSNVNGAHLVYLNNSDLVSDNIGFFGCATAGGLQASYIYNDSWTGIHIDGVKMKDFGSFNGVFYSKTPLVTAYSVIYGTCPAGSNINYTSTQVAEFRNIDVDEGVLSAVRMSCDKGIGKSIRNVVIDDLTGNVGNIGNSAIVLIGVDNAELNRISLGYSTSGGNMLYAQDCIHVTLKNSTYTNNAGGIYLDNNFYVTGTLTLIDTLFSNIVVVGNAKLYNFCSVGTCVYSGTLAIGTNSYATVSTIIASIESRGTIRVTNAIIPVGVTFANLGTPTNGNLIWCVDCTETDPCAGGGLGSWARRQNNRWKCN